MLETVILLRTADSAYRLALCSFNMADIDCIDSAIINLNEKFNTLNILRESLGMSLLTM